VEQVSQFRYLCGLISDDGYCTKEIRSRIEIAKKIYMQKKSFTGEVDLELKNRILKCLVWSAALYTAETYMLTQTDRKSELLKCRYGKQWKRSAGLMKLLMLLLRRVNDDRQILNSIWQRKHRRIGHVLRHDRLLHEITEGTV